MQPNLADADSLTVSASHCGRAIRQIAVKMMSALATLSLLMSMELVVSPTLMGMLFTEEWHNLRAGVRARAIVLQKLGPSL